MTCRLQERTTPPHPTTPPLRAAPCRRTFRPRRRANSFCRPGSAGGRSSTTPAGSSGSSASSDGSQVSAATTTSPPGCRTPPDQLTAECNSRCRVHLETRVTSPRTVPSIVWMPQRFPGSAWVASRPPDSSPRSATRRNGLDGSEHCDQEVGIVTPRTQVPRGHEQVIL